MRTIPFADVLLAQQSLDAGEKPAVDLDRLFNGALVLVGQTAKSIGDRGPVPLYEDRALVLVHANLLDNIIDDRLLDEPPLWLVLLFSVALAVVIGGAV